MPSLSYQILPMWLLEALMNQVLLAHEAAEINDLMLLSQSDVTVLPPHLHSAAERLALWEMEADQTLH